MSASERAFREARARDERKRALAADGGCARHVHLELSRLYEERAAKVDDPASVIGARPDPIRKV